MDVRSPQQVAQAVREVYEQLNVSTVVCHSAYWALAYGKPVTGMAQALQAGVAMAATRFRLGDDYDWADYQERQYDILADAVRGALDMERIYQIMDREDTI